MMAVGVMLFMLPVSSAIYNWKTEPRTESYSYTTASTTTGNVTLLKPVYDNDTATIGFISSLTSDTPALVSYDPVTQVVNFSGLTANATRTLTISYDTSAFNESAPFETIADMLPYLCYVCFVLFICSGVFYMLAPHVKDWLKD